MKSTSIDQTRCGLLRHPFLRLLVETSPNFPDGLHWDLDFRIPQSLPEIVTVPSAIGNMNCSPFFAVVISLALSLRAQLLNVCKPKHLLFKFHPRTAHIRGILQVKLLYQSDGALTGLSPFEKVSLLRSPNTSPRRRSWTTLEQLPTSATLTQTVL